MSKLSGSIIHERASSYSPCLVGYWKFDDGTGSVVKDYSGNGLDLSPLYAPTWKAGTTYPAQNVVTPTVSTGFFYECTTTGTTSSTTEPAWPTSAATTVTDGGTLVWTCRAVPDFWTTSPGFLTTTNSIISPLYSKAKRPWRPWESLLPTLKDTTSYTANTISAATADNSINDSSLAGVGQFPIFAVGDWVWISGFTGDTANNTISKVASSTTAKITFSGNTGVNAIDAEGEAVTIRKVLPPMSMVWRARVRQANTLAFNVPWFRFFENAGSLSRGIAINSIGASRLQNWACGDITGAGVNVNGSGVSVNTFFTLIVVVNRELATIEFYVDGVRDASGLNVMSKRAQCSMNAGLAQDYCLGFLHGSVSATFTSVIGEMHLYMGRSLPAGLTGTGSPALITTLNSGTVLTPTDWS